MLGVSVLRKRLPVFAAVPLFMFALGSALTLLAWFFLHQDATLDNEARFQARADELQAALIARFKAYEQVLNGVAGLFASSDQVTREEFRSYVRALNLGENFPGIQGVGYSVFLLPEQKTALEYRIRGEGFADFKIWPEGERPVYSSIIYLEPFQERNLRAFGYDMYSEPVRRKAMELAMNEHRTGMSGSVRLVQETETDVQPGFLMYVPIYGKGTRPSAAERHARLRGWAYAPFRMHDFMQGLLRARHGEHIEALDLQVADEDGAPMFQSAGTVSQARTVFRAVRIVRFAGRSWTMTLRGSSAFARETDPITQDILVIAAGMGATFSLTFVLWLLLGKKEREEIERRNWINAAAMDGFWLVSQTGRLLEVNEVYCSMSGYTREELRHMNISDVEVLETARDVQTRIAAIRRSGEARFESVHRRKDGTTFPVEVSVRFIHGTNDSMAAFLRDVTAAKESERALRESESRFRTLVESLREVVFTLDASGRHTGVYGSWVEKSGLTPEIFLGKTVREILGPDAAPVHDDAFRRAMTGEFVVYEWRLRDKFYETSLSPMTSDGIVVGVVGIGRDVTERERLAEALERNEKLHSIGTLAGGLAHDFNNLLGGIYGHIEAALQLTENAREREILERALETMHRARKLTGQLLTFSRAGKPDLGVHIIPDLVRKSVEFSLAGSGMKPVFENADPALAAVCDPAQIEQVIDNIVINARQATGNAGTLHVKTEKVNLLRGSNTGLAEGAYIRVSIQDNGPGIIPETREHIFDPFFSTKGEGRGLGLATSFSIVRRHGGTMEVESPPGKGATFRFYLPEGYASEETRGRERPLSEVTSGARILIMDDEPAMRESLAELLMLKGYSVGAAADGSEAIAMLDRAVQAKEPYAALILDLTVPGGMGGLEVARQLRRNANSTPIILMSGYAADAGGEVSEIVSATLTKPFTLTEVTNAVENSLKQR